MLARKLDKSGFKVIACCLFPTGAGAKQLRADCSSLLKIVKLDVTSDKDVDAAYEDVEKELNATNYRKCASIVGLRPSNIPANLINQ